MSRSTTRRCRAAATQARHSTHRHLQVHKGRSHNTHLLIMLHRHRRLLRLVPRMLQRLRILVLARMWMEATIHIRCHRFLRMSKREWHRRMRSPDFQCPGLIMTRRKRTRASNWLRKIAAIICTFCRRSAALRGAIMLTAPATTDILPPHIAVSTTTTTATTTTTTTTTITTMEE